MINARGIGIAALLAGAWFTAAALSQTPVLPPVEPIAPPVARPRRRRPTASTAAALLSQSPVSGWLR